MPQQPVMDIQSPNQVINPQPQQPSQQPIQPQELQSPQFSQPQQPSVPYAGQDMQQPAMPQQAQAPQGMPANAQEVGVPNYEQQHKDLNKQVKKKRRGLIFVIILAVIITIGLIGAAVYAFLQSRSNSAAPVETSEVTTEAVDDGRVDAADIDATTSEIDKSLNSLNDSEDFGSDALSDKTIGL